MTLCEELYFDIRITGPKSELKKFVTFLKSGELDDFFEILPEYIDYDDNYATADATTEVSIIFSNDDYGLEIDELDTDEFLEVFCKAGKNLHMRGTLFDADEEEYEFISAIGDSYYVNARRSVRFNDDEYSNDDNDDYEETY